MLMWGYGWTMLWAVFWNLFWLVLLGILIWGIIHWRSGQTFRPGGPDRGPAFHSALDILQERYARGEIDEATFERMWERLLASSRDGSPRSPEPG